MTAIQEAYTRDTFDLDAFVDHAKACLKQESSRPWCSADSVVATDGLVRRVQFTFDDEFLRQFIRNPKDFKKDIQSAFAYGYIGVSNGGRNGIVRLREEDVRMRRRVDDYVSKNPGILSECEIGTSREGVKIVVHRPNGLRTIGIRDTANDYILFFDRMDYQR